MALLGALAILATQQFLTVHALQHLGRPNHTHCEYAPLAATAGGGVLAAAAALPAPCVAAVVVVASPPASLARGALAKARARAPPLG